MEFQFLGTSSGTPTRTRNVAGLALRGEAPGWVLVDCGEGTQHRILRTKLTLHALRAVFITHLHGDHCYGLPGLLASAGLLNRTAPLAVVGPTPLRAYVEGVMATTQLHLPYALRFVDVHEIAGSDALSALLPELEVRATPLSHRLPSFAYSFTERGVERRLDTARLAADGVPAGPHWGLLQQGGDVVLADGRSLRAADYLLAPRKRRKIIVAGDNDQPALLAAEAVDADVLVHEATYTTPVLEKVGPGPQHSSAAMVAGFAQAARLPHLVLTHFSPRYQDLAGIEAEARAYYDGKLFLAADLARYGLDRHGVLARQADMPHPPQTHQA